MGKGRAKHRKIEGVSGRKKAGLEDVAKGGTKPEAGFIRLDGTSSELQRVGVCEGGKHLTGDRVIRTPGLTPPGRTVMEHGALGPRVSLAFLPTPTAKAPGD